MFTSFFCCHRRYAKDFNKEKPGAVTATAVGFMGPPGCKDNPSYREVCSGQTGHVEVCQARPLSAGRGRAFLCCLVFLPNPLATPIGLTVRHTPLGSDLTFG